MKEEGERKKGKESREGDKRRWRKGEGRCEKKEKMKKS